jgi:hypothetical protein
MAFLDYAVRPEGSPPPLQHPFVLFGNRISWLVVTETVVILAFYLYFFRSHHLLGFAVYIILQMALGRMEGLTSNRYGENILRLRRAGYSDGVILFYQEFNRVASQSLAYILVNYIATDPSIYTLAYLTQGFGVRELIKIGVRGSRPVKDVSRKKYFEDNCF